MTIKQYLPHQQRVVDERNELNEKADKLLEFIRINPIFEELNERDKALLREQYQVMCKYQNILQERIANFNKK